jgi:hypothetical protein
MVSADVVRVLIMLPSRRGASAPLPPQRQLGIKMEITPVFPVFGTATNRTIAAARTEPV